MAKKEDKKSGAKKGCMGCLIAILVPILIAIMIFAIFMALIEFILGVVSDIITGVIKFLAHPIRSLRKAWSFLDNHMRAWRNSSFQPNMLEKNRLNQLIEFTQEDFETMRDELDKSISQEATGLDDIMLKKMILTYNTGKYSKYTDIIIELTDEEVKAIQKDDSLAYPFKMIKGGSLKQLEYNSLDAAASWVEQTFELGESDRQAIEDERNSKKDKNKNWYLHANGTITFLNQDGGEMLYYDQSVLKKIYDDYFQAYRYDQHEDYAMSAWNYLSSKCYTDGGDSTIVVYSHEIIEEEMIEWTYDDKTDSGSFWDTITDAGDESLREIILHRVIVRDEYLVRHRGDGLAALWEDSLLDIGKKEYKTQEIEYYSLVAQYSTPIEFMVDLLNISSSKEFVDAFMGKVVGAVTENYVEETIDIDDIIVTCSRNCVGTCTCTPYTNLTVIYKYKPKKADEVPIGSVVVLNDGTKGEVISRSRK